MTPCPKWNLKSYMGHPSYGVVQSWCSSEFLKNMIWDRARIWLGPCVLANQRQYYYLNLLAISLWKFLIFFFLLLCWIFSIVTPVFSVTWSFRNQYNMLICCSRNISCYYLIIKKVVLLCIFVETVIVLFQDSFMNRKFKRTEFIWNKNVLKQYECFTVFFWPIYCILAE